VANLELLDKMDLVTNAAEVGGYLNQAMREALGGHPHVGDVRGEGMLCAIEFVADKATRRRYDPVGKIGPQVAGALLKRGVIGRAMPHGDILGFAPPLCLTHEEADALVSATVDAIREVYDTA
jgi:L-2,4-diaminobutyrate transaminase